MVWYGLVWSGLVWSGLVWSGLVWTGVVWSGVVWSGVVWSGMVYIYTDFVISGNCVYTENARLRLVRRAPFFRIIGARSRACPITAVEFIVKG